MSTATEPVVPITPPPAVRPAISPVIDLLPHLRPGWAMTLPGVTWAEYDRLLDARDQARAWAVKLTYDRGRLDLVTKSNTHELWKTVVGLLVTVWAEEAAVPVVGCGETTVRREDLDRGFEPDQWFYVGPTVARVLPLGRELDFTTDPPPDLAVEIEVSRKLGDRIDLYAAVGVPEVWAYDGHQLVVYTLGPNRGYTPATTSRALGGLPAADLARYLGLAGTVDQVSIVRQFRAWVRQTLVPPGSA